jgi:hypothetical protein
VLLALAGRRFFSRSAGVAAGLILAFYAPAIFADGLIQKSALGLSLLCLLLWLLGAAVLDTLAAAYAAAGRFEEAAATAERALVAARRDGDHQFVAEIRARLEFYREDQPYRRPSLARGAEARR